MLNSAGVRVVVERHLPKTYLDGAAMLLDGKDAIIALTLRHDRLDNFWFVLFHELGHIVRHRNRSEEHTSELQSLMRISYAVFCLKKKKTHLTVTCSRLS